MEQWKDIPEFEDFYLASSFGRIMSIAPGRAKTRGRMLSPRNDGRKNGYLTVCLYKGGERHYKKVHRLVASAFLRPPKDGEQINHKDGNKRNNHIENLEWVSAKENVQHSHALGLNAHRGYKYRKPIRCVETGKVFDSAVEAADKMGLGSSPTTAGGNIRDAVTGRALSRRAYGYHWEEV